MSNITAKFEFLKKKFDYIPRKPVDDILTKPCFVIDGSFQYPRDDEYEWDWIERLYEQQINLDGKIQEFLNKKYE